MGYLTVEMELDKLETKAIICFLGPKLVLPLSLEDHVPRPKNK